MWLQSSKTKIQETLARADQSENEKNGDKKFSSFYFTSTLKY